MKKALYFIVSALIATAVTLAAMSFAPSDAPENAEAANPVSNANHYRYTWNLDTIVNAAKDTLMLPTVCLSNFEWAYFIERTNISGTTNIAVSVQATATNTGTATDWTQVDITSATTATNEIVSGTSFHGLRHRIIVNGTGTQSTSYRIRVVLKKKN